MKTDHQQRVEQFMVAAEQNVRALPSQNIPIEELKLRASLILEEAFEEVSALGFDPLLFMGTSRPALPFVFKDILLVPHERGLDIVAAVDGCADLSVVTTGTLSCLGVQDESVLQLVDENNLQKILKGHRNPKTGKWEKPADHQPPDILGELERQRAVYKFSQGS